eukprot:GHVT01024382.1.p2 GENE.GHVT01024382.1~~GHVT01024382.1.p2  ORF type:complete len:100 (-),score=9.77 GHVT01024382.1:147-446(-)
MKDPPALLWCGSEGASGRCRLSGFALKAARCDFPILSYQWLDFYLQGRPMPLQPYLLRLVGDLSNPYFEKVSLTTAATTTRGEKGRPLKIDLVRKSNPV